MSSVLNKYLNCTEDDLLRILENDPLSFRYFHSFQKTKRVWEKAISLSPRLLIEVPLVHQTNGLIDLALKKDLGVLKFLPKEKQTLERVSLIINQYLSSSFSLKFKKEGKKIWVYFDNSVFLINPQQFFQQFHNFSVSEIFQTLRKYKIKSFNLLNILEVQNAKDVSSDYIL